MAGTGDSVVGCVAAAEHDGAGLVDAEAGAPSAAEVAPGNLPGIEADLRVASARQMSRLGGGLASKRVGLPSGSGGFINVV